MMTIILYVSPFESIRELFHFCDCKTTTSPQAEVFMQQLCWAARQSSPYFYPSHCSNPLSFPDGDCAVLCVCCCLLVVYWIGISGSSVHWPLHHVRVHSLVISNIIGSVTIILYTATGSVNRFGGWAGAKTRGDQWYRISNKTKPATASSHIFWS